MPMTADQYREHLYTQKSHPESHPGVAYPTNDSFAPLYLTLVPFLVGEYWAELKVDTLPSGIVFPTAYLLFWAFYFTYYRPGFLESKLSSPGKWDLFAFPTILMGITIWFVKVVFVEFTEVALSHFFNRKKARPQVRRPQPAYRPPQQQQQAARPPTQPELPKDILSALAIMGLAECRDWRTVQKRYRELAKKYHPDLNPDITTAGNRFMIYDGAYRRLAAVRQKYFIQ